MRGRPSCGPQETRPAGRDSRKHTTGKLGLQAAPLRFLGQQGCQRRGRRDVGLSLGGHPLADLIQSAPVERPGEPGLQAQRGVVVGNGLVEVAHPQAYQPAGVERTGFFRFEAYCVVAIRKRFGEIPAQQGTRAAAPQVRLRPVRIVAAIVQPQIELGEGRFEPPGAPVEIAQGQTNVGVLGRQAVHGIQVNAIAPGYFATEMNRALLDDAKFDAWVKARTPSGRWGQPDEIAGLAVFLASSAADYITGQMIMIDGGMSVAL